MADKVAALVIKVDSQGVQTAANRLKRLSTAARGVEKELRDGTRAVRPFRSEMDSAARSTKMLSSGAKSAASGLDAMGASARKTKGLDRNLRRTAGSMQTYERSTAGAARTTRAFGRNVNLTAQGIAGIVQRALAATAAFVAFNKAMQATKFAFDVSAQFERLDKQLEFVTGSARNATEAMAFLTAEADRTGQNILQIAPTFAQLQFAMAQAGLTADDARELFQGVGSAAATFGLAQADVNGILRAFVQVASKGRVQAEELRGQIGERIPGAFGLAAKSMGVTTEELSKMLELGQVAATDLLPKLARELNNTFGQGIEDKTNTITAAVGRLRTGIALLVEELGLADNFRDTINAVARGVEGLRQESGEALARTVSEVTQLQREVERVGGGEDLAITRRLRAAEEQLESLIERATDQELSDAFGLLQVELAGAFRERTRETVKDAIDIVRQAREELRDETAITLALDTRQFELFERDATRLTDIFRNFRQEAAGTFDDFSFGLQVDPTAQQSIFALNTSLIDTETRVGAVTDAAFEFNAVLAELGPKIGNLFQGGEGVDPQLQSRFDALREQILSANRTPLEEMERAHEDAMFTIVSQQTEAYGQITEEGWDLIRMLEGQYAQDTQNYIDAQQRKALEASSSYKFIARSTEAVEDALVNAASEGKTAFDDLFQFMLAEIQRVILRATVLNSLYSGLGGLFTAGGFGGIGAAFTAAANPNKEHGGYVPSGSAAIVGEAGPEIVTGPAVVTSARSTADQSRQTSSKPTQVNNFSISMGGGVSPQEFAQLQRIVASVNGSVESRSVAAVQQMFHRNPAFGSR